MRRTDLKVGVLLLAMGFYSGPALADVLITARESRLPDADKRERGPMMGPRVMVSWPARGASAVTSPFPLAIKFESRDGVPVDLNSLVVTYEKSPPVDLTERVKAYLSPTGISMPQAETPPGKHFIHVEIKDVNGRLGGTEFSIDAAP